MKQVRMVVILSALAVSLLAVYHGVRLATADVLFRQAAEEAVAGAIRLDPSRADLHAALSEFRFGELPASVSALRRAAELSSRDSDLRVRLGLREENAGNFAEAERQLLEAAALSAKHKPRWALANFYLRRNQDAEFWKWMEEAARTSYGDRGALFHLCWDYSPEADRILRDVVGARPDLRHQYALFLIGKQQWNLANRLLEEWAESPGKDDVRPLLNATDRLLVNAQFDGALTIWNSLCRAGHLPFRPLSPQESELVTNNEFSELATGSGFDWRIDNVAGVHSSWRSGDGLRIQFSGEQSQRCEILRQYLPVPADRSVTLRYDYETRPSPLAVAAHASGLRWKVYAHSAQGSSLVAESEMLAAEGSHEGELRIRAPGGTAGAGLVLYHERVPGSTRMEAALHLKRVSATVE